MQAARYDERLNEQQRRWVELDGIWVGTHDGERYLEAMARYEHDYPDDPRSALFAGLAHEWLLSDCETALVSYGNAYANVPRWYPVTKARVDCLTKLGRHAEAKEALRGYLALSGLRGPGREKAVALLAELEQGS